MSKSLNYNKITNPFYFISDEGLATILNFELDSYKYLYYKEFVLAVTSKRDLVDKHNPVPSTVYSPKFHKHVLRLYEGKLFGYSFVPERSFFYCLFVGFYFFIIWKLGGGRRFHPLISPYAKCNYFGFYDLSVTPLALVVSFYTNYQFYFNDPHSVAVKGRFPFRFLNSRDIFQGATSSTTKSDWVLFEYPDFINDTFFRFRYLLAGFVIRVLLFVPIFVFHFFLRPFFFGTIALFFYFFYICVFENEELDKKLGLAKPVDPIYHSLPYDLFWKKVYFNYFLSVDNYYNPLNELVPEFKRGFFSTYYVSLSKVYSYGDFKLFDNFVLSRFTFYQLRRYWKKYRYWSPVSIVSGLLASSVVAKMHTQNKLFFILSASRFEDYKRFVLQHSLSIPYANIIGKKISTIDSSKERSSLGRSPLYTVLDSGSTHDNDRVRFFSLFVFNYIDYLRFSTDNFKKIYYDFFNTSFYQIIFTRSRFLLAHSLKFNTVFLSYVVIFVKLPVNIVKFLVIFICYNYGYISSHSSNSSNTSGNSRAAIRTHGFKSRTFRKFDTFFGLFGFIFNFFKLLVLYCLSPIKIFLSLLYRFAAFAQRTFYLQSFYFHFYYFQRFFYSTFFTRFFTREIDDEVDQIREILDKYDYSWRKIENDSADFEYSRSDFPLGSSLPFDHLDHDEYNLDKGELFPSYSENILGETRNIEGNQFLEQLFWGWLSIHYEEDEVGIAFSRADTDEYYKFKSSDKDSDTLGALSEALIINDWDHTPVSFGFEDTQFEEAAEDWESEYYEEFYYDPQFFECSQRYYDYFLGANNVSYLGEAVNRYRIKLDSWKSDVSKTLTPIPHEFLLMPTHFRRPQSLNDWKILTLLISTIVLKRSELHTFSSFSDVEFMNRVWSRFSYYLRLNPDALYEELDSSDFDRNYTIIERKFSKVLTELTNRDNGTWSNWFKRIFSAFINWTFWPRFGSIFVVSYDNIDFSKLDYIFFSTSPNPALREVSDDFVLHISEISRLETLSVVFYLRFLADQDVALFYNFITTDVGYKIWCQFEPAFKLSVKYSPNSFEYISKRLPYSRSFGSANFSYFSNSRVKSNFYDFIYAHDDVAYVDYTNYNSRLVGTFEDLLLLTVHNFYKLFNPYSTEKLPFDSYSPLSKPLESYAGIIDDSDDSVVDTRSTDDPGIWGPTATMNIVGSVFFDSYYAYIIDPAVCTALFPFAYEDFIEDVFEIDETEFELDLYDQFILGINEEESLDSILYYVNEGLINEDVDEDIDFFDPSGNEFNTGFMDNPDPFNSDDPETYGDLPFYAGDIELYIDESLEGGEDWEPEESDSFTDLAIPINRLFFGTLSRSTYILPGVDPRLYSGKILSDTDSAPYNYDSEVYDISYTKANRSAFINNSYTKALAPAFNSSPILDAQSNSPIAVFSRIVFSNFFYLYFSFIAFIFNISFYTYVNDINHLKNARIIQHFDKYQSGYQASFSFIDKLKYWIAGFEDFKQESTYLTFKNSVARYGGFFVPTLSNHVNKFFSSFAFRIPYTDYLFNFNPWSEEEVEFGVSVYQNYDDWERFDVTEDLDTYENSRFYHLDVLELYNLDELFESVPLEELFNEEINWDAGADFSFSSDDILAEFQLFNNKISILFTALSSIYSLATDYYIYLFNSKFYLYCRIPLSYINLRSDYEWAKLAAKYGNLAYFFRYAGSSALVLALFIYFSFIFPRVFYWFFVHELSYGYFHFTVAIFSFMSLFISLLLFLPKFSSFYKNFNSDERLAFYSLVVLIWFQYVFGGYARSPWSVLDWIHPDRYVNLSTEPDIVPRVISLEPEDINTSTVEASGRFILFEIKGERQLFYNPEVPQAPTHRRQYLNFNYTAAPMSIRHFYDYMKYNLFGFRNYHFTGYKYIHVAQEPIFIKYATDNLYSYIHRIYATNLGGVPRRFKRMARRRYADIARGLSRVWPMYWYSTTLSGKDEYYAADPSNFIVDFSLYNSAESTPPHPYDFRPVTFFSVDDYFYNRRDVFSYSSKFNQRSDLVTYNFNLVGPRKNIVFFRGQRYYRYSQSSKFNKRRMTNYVYRYGRVGRFKHFAKKINLNHQSSSATVLPIWFYSTLSKSYFNFVQINNAHFLFNYSANFYKYILHKNFRRSKNYIDFFTFRPSQLYPRTRGNRKHTLAFDTYFNTVDSIYRTDSWSEYDQYKTKWEELEALLDADTWLTRQQNYAYMQGLFQHVLHFRHYSRVPTFHPESELELRKKEVDKEKKYDTFGKPYIKGFHQPFFNFARYSRFVAHYNKHLRIVYPASKVNYYLAAATFIDKYSGKMGYQHHNSYKTFVSGLPRNNSKFDYFPTINSRFSRDPARRIRKQFKNARKDLVSFSNQRFRSLHPFVETISPNYSFVKKYVRPRGHKRYLVKRRKFNKRFSNAFIYRFPRFTRYRRFVVRLDAPIRYQRIFNNYRIYRSNWYGGFKGFNRSFVPTSPPNKSLKEYEKRVYKLLYELGDKPTSTVLSDKLDVPYYNVPNDFLLDYYTRMNPHYDYYRYSPLAYAYNVVKFRLLDSSDKANPSIFYLWGFEHPIKEFELDIEYTRLLKVASTIEDFNRSTFFSSFIRPPNRYRYKNRIYIRRRSIRRPYFYRYLYIGARRYYSRANLTYRLKKGFTKEFVKSYLIKPINLNYPLPKPPKRQYIFHHAKNQVDPFQRDIFATDSYIEVRRPSPKLKSVIYAKQKYMFKKKYLRAVHRRRMRALPAYLEKARRMSRAYKGLIRRYDVSEHRRYVKNSRRRIPLLKYLFRKRSFLGNDNIIRFNERLGESQAFLARERRRKKAALKELKRRREQKKFIRQKQSRNVPSKKAGAVSVGSDVSVNDDSSDGSDINSRDPFSFLFCM